VFLGTPACFLVISFSPDWRYPLAESQVIEKALLTAVAAAAKLTRAPVET
jgi:hypothetical protein